MSWAKAGFLVLSAILVIAVAQMGYYWPQLPPRVASEFDFQGKAGDWMSKTSFVLTEAGTMLAMVVFPLLVGWHIRVLPAWLIDMPNKDYWLAPERRRQTAAAVSAWLVWLFVATALLLTGIFQLVYLANLGHPNAMRQPPLWLLGAYAAFMAAWLIGFYRRFRHPKQGSPNLRDP